MEHLVHSLPCAGHPSMDRQGLPITSGDGGVSVGTSLNLIHMGGCHEEIMPGSRREHEGDSQEGGPDIS